ncbi:substrate-binding family protein [Leucobacter komagatae]|uniref:Substrate-binding family protein n=1 Tax=Leucobacter komagatae TaxID=55969 RepID=A0A542XY53_9MICO|nr:ABC transporter substrate-binding protein [Leucobacter komagatae]TQL40765.1 substrate-binding family protein [Leucobacter komagatae]
MSRGTTAEDLTEMSDDAGEAKRFSWRSRRGLIVAICVVVVLAVAAAVVFGVIRGNRTVEQDPVAVTVPVPIRGVDVPAQTKVGVIVTTGSGSAEASDWAQAADGAVVARERLALGGSEIELVVENDKGTANGSAEAMTALVEQGVVGVVYASSGSHIEAGIDVASEHGLAVVLPFEQVPESSKGVWTLAPESADLEEQFARVLASYERPLHVNAGRGLPEGVKIADELVYRSGSGPEGLAMQAAEMTGSDPLAHGGYAGGTDDEEDGAEEAKPAPQKRVDAIVLSGPALLQANITQELQSRNVTVPILLTPAATSPNFEAMLALNGASVSPTLRTIGYDWDDAVALGNDGRGRSSSAFLAAIRLLSADGKTMNLTEDASFAEVSGAADGRAHDAVLALARAAADAGSTEPARVSAALAGLSLVAGDSITGPEMDFASPQVVSAKAVELYATGQQLGLRPESEKSTDVLVWFTEPAAQ